MGSGKNTTLKMSLSGDVKMSFKLGCMALLDPRLERVRDAEGVRLDGECRVGAAGGRHAGAVGQVQVVELPGAAVRVEHGVVLVGAEARAGEGVVGDPRR